MDAMRGFLPETRAFLRDWLDWVERGAPNRKPYRRYWGLCSNADEFDHSGGVSVDLCDAFKRDYPFGEGDYSRRGRAETMHKCPKRLAFARKHAAEKVA
jgi:hypothetical protein